MKKLISRRVDINLTGPWTPIGDNRSPFTGTYNGNGHTISDFDNQ